jgi:hypothetical protein
MGFENLRRGRRVSTPAVKKKVVAADLTAEEESAIERGQAARGEQQAKLRAEAQPEETWLGERAKMDAEYRQAAAGAKEERKRPGLPGWDSGYTAGGTPNPFKAKPEGNPPGPAMTYGFEEEEFVTPGRGLMTGRDVTRTRTVPRDWREGEQESVKGSVAKKRAILQEILAQQREKRGE